MKKIILIVALLLAVSCTKQERAKSYGGEATITLPAGKKLLNITWKGDDMWVLMKDSDSVLFKPQTYNFNEYSSYGLLQGKIVIKEQTLIKE